MKKDFVSLAEARPDLAKEWNYEKNGDLKPEDVSCGSGKKVWWKLPYDVPDDYPVESLRGKHFDFEWEAKIASRSDGNDCPYLAGKAVLAGFNDLATINQDLATQWHPTKNGNLKPTQVTAGSDRKVWWLLPYDVPDDYPIESLRGKHFDFEWQATIASRNKGNDCPYLSGQAVWEGFNDLQTLNPDIAAQWHPIKNKNLNPMQVTANTNKKVWWLLPYDVPDDYPIESLRGKHFEFEWKTSIVNRNKGNGCPYLSGQAVWERFNDLQTLNPDLAAQWHPVKNKNLNPTQVTVNTDKKVWWLLPYDVPDDYPIESLRGKHFDFEWQAIINSRNAGVDCPYLSGKVVWSGFNDLSTTNPELAAQWHPTKNGDLKPIHVTAGSHRKVWWLLPYDVSADYPIKSLRGKHFDFEWKACILDRTSGYGCPYLSSKAIWKGFNDLETVNPELAAQWHPTKNGNLKPIHVMANSNKKVWWLCKYDDPVTGKCFDFEWKSDINSRNNGTECPFLSGHAVWKGFNDLQTINPEVAAQWHPTKNGDLKPTQVTANSAKKIWWCLPYDVPDDYPIKSLRGKHFDFEWKEYIYKRNNGHGCPYLSSHTVWEGFNDLQTVNPELAAQWHPTKNGDLKPTQVTANSNKKVWWILSYDDRKSGNRFEFEWKTTVHNRNNGNGCPYLSGKSVLFGFNDLQTVNPELAKQ